MRYLAEIGHLKNNQIVNLGTAQVRADASGASLLGRDRGGKPWRVALALSDGMGWTEVWSADFDGDGQRDFLLGNLFPGNGACVNGLGITVLLFDEAGRPMPWTANSFLPAGSHAFPYLPVLAMDVDRDGRAEFVITDCDRGRSGAGSIYSIAGIYEADAGRLRVVPDARLGSYRRAAGPLPAHPSRWRDRMPGLDARATGRLEELATGGDASGEEMRLSGRIVKQWPDSIVLDGPDGRDICLAGCWLALLRILREGYMVKWIEGVEGEASWLWADLHQPAHPARVDVEMEVTSARHVPVHSTPAEGHCREFLYSARESGGEVTMQQRCTGSGMWTASGGGTREELLPDRRSIRTSHTAMGHTVTFETRFERPPGGGVLRGMAKRNEMILTQWDQAGGSLFSLHNPNGELVAWQVRVPVRGDLTGYVDGWLFSTASGATVSHVTAVDGNFRWRRE